MAASESEMDREILNRIAEAYFAARRRRQSADSATEGGASKSGSGAVESRNDDPALRKGSSQHRRFWREAFRFTPLMIL
jgi:hypothetical protein